VITVRYPSLELNWLPLSMRKGLDTPRVVALENEHRWGGFYMRRERSRCVVESLDMDLKEGPVIALCGSCGPGTIAHEFRHHWQIQSGYKFRASVWQIKPNATLAEYRRCIVKYFRSFWWEMDALRFEIKHAPTELSLLWMDWLRG